jgi:polyphosphate kinase 2 (PPK2 family)
MRARMGRLDELDLSLKLSREEEQTRLEKGGERIAQLRLTLGGALPFGDGERRLGPPLCLVFEGWDASGKGGAIKRLVSHLDPRHMRYSPYAAPTPDEKRHQYLHRFAPALPGWGGMSIIDRSWYGRVLVERVEGFATRAEWSRAYDEINGFERTLAADGMIFCKFWLHISDEEQLKRFRKREHDPLKSYKLTDEDWRNRKKRKKYVAALEDMFERTDTEWAPWTLVEGDSKRWARVKVIETTIAAIESGMRKRKLKVPPPVGHSD